MPTDITPRAKADLSKPDASGVSGVQRPFTPREVQTLFIQLLSVLAVPIVIVGGLHIRDQFSPTAKFLVAPGLHVMAHYVKQLPRPQPYKWPAPFRKHDKR
jgi:hypothetical protein